MKRNHLKQNHFLPDTIGFNGRLMISMAVSMQFLMVLTASACDITSALLPLISNISSPTFRNQKQSILKAVENLQKKVPFCEKLKNDYQLQPKAGW